MWGFNGSFKVEHDGTDLLVVHDSNRIAKRALERRRLALGFHLSPVILFLTTRIQRQLSSNPAVFASTEQSSPTARIRDVHLHEGALGR